ncbi:MAG TPA: glycoside hydrolase family 3 protein, partial [Spirochaetia bacterium]|nr:glycoside hydrolase family 3 protein [Spirochaetia bacterium]
MEQKLLKRALLAAAFFASFLAAAPAARADVNFYSRFPDNVLADRLVASMSDEELLGQIFLLGYSGFTVTPELLAWIRDHGLGAVKIFGWNANNLSELTASISTMQRAAHGNRLQIPLIIATDQEGGWVRHIRGDTSITPGNMAIGATDLPEDAHRTGYYIGTELKALGINMDFAPTVDVYSNPHADVIGSRSFGSDPVRTGLLSVAFFRGLKQVGIISTAKHYPGHGAAGSDSHLTLPVIPASLNLLWDRDLVPYRFLIKEGIPAIMAGHLAYPQITGKVWPATLSRYFETQLLRERLGFQGLI